MKDYVGIAKEYALEVVNGRILASRVTQQGCQRFLDDLTYFGKTGEYVLDHDKANFACAWVENLRHVTGPKGGQLFVMEPWQVFADVNIFGWLGRDGYRRFRYTFEEVPRGNGKSFRSSARALYMMCADGEMGAHCYSFATTGDQARQVFDASLAMCKANDALVKHYGLMLYADSITCPRTNSFFQPRNSTAHRLDGLNTHFACLDEVHAYPDRLLYDVVRSSLTKRAQPLLWCITTAGYNRHGICRQLHDKALRVLSGEMRSDEMFTMIYTIDPEDDWTTEEAARKANPNLNVSTSYREIKSAIEDAKHFPANQAEVKIKYFNIWCNNGQSWVDVTKWDALAKPMTLEDFEGQECFIGVDLSSKNDLTAKVYVFPKLEGEQVVYYVFAKFYLPAKTIDTSPNTSYRQWVQDGYLEITPGGVINQDYIEEDLVDDLDRFDVRMIGYDPWNAEQLARHLETSASMVSVRSRSLSEPMKYCQAFIYDERIHHDGNPVLSWCIGNTIERVTGTFSRPEKEHYDKKIDGTVALFNALALALVHGLQPPEQVQSEYQPSATVFY